MQRKQRYFFRTAVLTAFFSCLMLTNAQAKPLVKFIPASPTTLSVVKGDKARVVYTVVSNSPKKKTLFMKPIRGITANVCELGRNGRCRLILTVNGSALRGDVLGGPILCQRGSGLQCYRPSAADILRIRLINQPPVQQFTVTPSAGANGSISPATAKVVNAGSTLTFTARPNTGFGVNQWLLDGKVVQNGGASFLLSNIRANHSVLVTFAKATLSPLYQNMALSIKSPGSDPALVGKARIIRIKNSGSIATNNVQVSASGFPAGTMITSNTCVGTLNAGATCDITITPGGTASPDANANACTTSPGSEPVPTTVTVSADNAPSTLINVLVLGYGCIYQGGFLFSVDDTSPATGNIGGKVAALSDESNPVYQWATVFNDTAADSLTDGLTNTNALTAPVGQYPAAQVCLNKNAQGFNDWFLPAFCELGRSDPGCGTSNPNLYTTLHTNGLGGFGNNYYWSSSEYTPTPTIYAMGVYFGTGTQFYYTKDSNIRVRCIRAFTS